MKPFFISILTLLLSLQVFATPQAGDRLIYKGDTLYICNYPLEYYSNIDSLMKFKLFGDEYDCISSGCWRGYIGEWTIINKQLYLTGLYDGCYGNIKADLSRLFGKKCVKGKVKADWFTGNIIAPKGNFISYMGFSAIHEYELEFYFEKGKLKQTQLYDNSKTKQSGYIQDFEELKKHIYNNINWKILQENASVEVIVEFSANENGIIDSARVLKGYNEIYDQEAIRVIKSIPEWSIYYRKGKFVRDTRRMPVVFSEENRLEYKK